MTEIRYVQTEDWRKLGYKDCDGFVIDVPGYEQSMEMFLIKGI